jgi:hypothetical protein
MSTEALVFWFWASTECLRFLARGLVQTGKGSVKIERSEPKGNLDGFLARLHDSQKTRQVSSKPAALGRSLNGRIW